MREVKLTIDDLTNERPGGPHRFILHCEFVFSLQDFVALLWSAQACLRFKGDGTFPSAPKRQQAAALQRAQWGVILLLVAARLLRINPWNSWRFLLATNSTKNDHCDLDVVGLKYNFSEPASRA